MTPKKPPRFASCVFCHQEFQVYGNQTKHGCRKSVLDYNVAKMRKWTSLHGPKERYGSPASCLYCKMEFVIRTDRGQKRHGCKQAQRDAHNARLRELYQLKKVDVARKRKEIFTKVRISENLRKCPECGTLTANRYRCSECWGRKDNAYDVGALITFGSGEARRIRTHLGERW